MNRLILGTALVGAMSGPALAGPALEALLPENVEWSAEREEVDALGERYWGVTMKRGNWTASADELAVAPDGDLVGVQMKAVTMEHDSGETTDIARVSMRFPAVAEGDPIAALEGIPEARIEGMTPEECREIDYPFALSLKQVQLENPGEAQVAFEAIDVRYDILDPGADCIMDMALGFSGMQVRESGGLDLAIDEMSLAVYSPVPTDRAPSDLSRDFTGDFVLSGLTIGMGGVEQGRIDRVSSRSRMDAGSMTSLVESGYHDLVSAVMASKALGEQPDLAGISLPVTWNAMRDLEAEGEFRIEGAELTGDMAQMLTGSQFLARGRSLETSLTYRKEAETLGLAFGLSSPGVLFADLELALVMTPMDEGLAQMGASAFMMSMPVSVASVSVDIEDQGAGEMIENQLGLDPYAMAGPFIAGNIGPAKAQVLTDWLALAREGGARFRATPAVPLPLMQVFAGFMGDWAAFGQTIGARTGTE